MDISLLDRLTTSDPATGRLACGLCAHRCVLRAGQTARCGAIINQEGRLRSLADGHPVVLHGDPIERKPLYHVLPGTQLLSLGTLGCNMTCDFCQNWRISQARPTDEGALTPPEAVVAAALEQGCAGIAFTYNEPTIYLDYATAIMALAKQAGLISVFKSNGYLTPEAIEALTPFLPLPLSGRGRTQSAGRAIPMRKSEDGVHSFCPPLKEAMSMPDGSASLLDAINIDLKGFDDGYYQRVCGARLQPVLDAIEHLHRRGVWVEVTTLIIPGVNDSEDELRALTGWLASVSPDIPWHVWRFHPDYRMADVAWTHVRDVDRAVAIGRAAGLRYVYASNLPGDSNQHTRCPSCRTTLIERVGNATMRMRMDGGQQCGGCGWVVPGLFTCLEVN